MRYFIFCLLMLVSHQLSADCRLHDFTRCDMIEENIVISRKTGEFNFQQLVAFHNVYNSEYQGLEAITYVYISEFEAIYVTPTDYLLVLKNGALIKTPFLYQSITYHDIELQYKRRYYTWEPVMYPVRFRRRQYRKPESFVLPQSEEHQEEAQNNVLIDHVLFVER